MTFDVVPVPAKHLPLDVFIFLENENRFFWVDDIDVLEDSVRLYFEYNIKETEGGYTLDDYFIDLPLDEKVYVVSEYLGASSREELSDKIDSLHHIKYGLQDRKIREN